MDISQVFSAVAKYQCGWSSEGLISSIKLGIPRHSPVDVGVAAGEDEGGGGATARPLVQNSGRDVRPEIATFKENFMKTFQNLQFFQYFQNKVTELRGEIRISGYMGFTHLNPSP